MVLATHPSATAARLGSPLPSHPSATCGVHVLQAGGTQGETGTPKEFNPHHPPPGNKSEHLYLLWGAEMAFFWQAGCSAIRL